MCIDKSTARRVSIYDLGSSRVQIVDDPSGTHILVTVEEWERTRSALRVVVGVWDDPPISMTSTGGMKDAIDIARRALAEIGGEK